MSEKRQNLDLKAGSLIVFSEGQYSDYGYRGAYVVLCDVSEAMMKDAVRVTKLQASQLDDSFGSISRFEPELIRRGWLATIDLREIYLGSYGELKVEL